MTSYYEKEAINRFNKVYTITHKENELIFICPKCKRPKLYVNTSNGVFHCFRCDYKGKIKNKPTLSNLKNSLSEENNKNRDNTDNVVYLIPFHRQKLTEEQKIALYSRGLNDDDIKYYNITGGNRIQIPNYVKGNFTDNICAWEWQKDKITKTNPKYLYDNRVKTSNIVFNLHNIPENSDIMLFEGVFNAITAGKNAVASYGCHLSEQQLKLILLKKPKSITLAYDSDEAGQKGNLQVIKELKKAEYKGKVYYLLLPEGKDANDLGKEKFKEYLQEHIIELNIYNVLSASLPKLLFLNNLK